MCGFCREPNCSSPCFETLEKILNLFSESLKESYASTRGEIASEFEFRMRSLGSRGDDLIRELETKCRQDLLAVERLIGLLEFAKSCDQCDRNRIAMHISEQLKNNVRFDEAHQFCPQLLFTCDKLGLEQAIAHYGSLEQREVTCFEGETKGVSTLFGGNSSPWHASNGVVEKDIAIPFEKHRNRLKLKSISGNTDSESFEMLECSPSSNCSYSFPSCDKPEAPRTEMQTSLFPEFNVSSWLLGAYSSSSKCEEGDKVYPTITANSSFWLCNERTERNFSDGGLETRMATLALGKEKGERTEDIGSSSLVPCEFVNGEPSCKRLGECATQLASDVKLMPTKPHVGTWVSRHTPLLNEQKSGPEVSDPESDAPDAPMAVTQLRKIGATDYSMWLSTKSRCEMVSNPLAERVLPEGCHEQGDGWKEKWLQKRPDSAALDHLDRRAAKKTRLANLVLDNRENMETNVEATPYAFPLIDGTRSWLQMSFQGVIDPVVLTT